MASVAGAVGGVLTNCMGCMLFVESIAKKQPGAMNLMTFATFSFISFIGFFFTMQMGRKKFQIPISGYWKVVTVFFIVNVVNNQALNYHVPVPLHIIFRSGSLLASLVMTVLLEGKSYAVRKYIAVAAITIGIIVCTLATSNASGKDSGMSMAEAQKHYNEWVIGISMLVFALFASAYLGILQGRMFRQYGRHTDEALFVTHAASLPFFVLMYSDISRSMAAFSADVPYVVPYLATTLPVPTLWMEMALSSIMNYGCIYYVYHLTAHVEPLSVTMVVTLRKFLSLIVSIWWFQNPFTFEHWIGTALVFAGSIAFA